MQVANQDMLQAVVNTALFTGTMDAMSVPCETGNKPEADAVLARTYAMMTAGTITQQQAQEIAGIYVETFGGL